MVHEHNTLWQQEGNMDAIGGACFSCLCLGGGIISTPPKCSYSFVVPKRQCGVVDRVSAQALLKSLLTMETYKG